MSFYPLLQHVNTATLARMERAIGQTVTSIFQPWHLATGFYGPLLKRKVGSASPPRGASSIQIGRRDSVVQVRCPGEGVFRQPEMRDGEGAVQPGDAGESVPAIPPVDINTRAANRQTVELALDGAVQFGIVHVLAHGVASLTASVLDFGGERMSEAELVSLMSSQKALQFVFLACCNGYEAACYSCLRGRPKVDRLRDVRGLDSFAPRQVRDTCAGAAGAMSSAPA